MPQVDNLDERIGALIIAKIDEQSVLSPEFPIWKYFRILDDSDCERMIEIFEWRYRFWILQFAERLSYDPDGGFAVLVLLNAYFDMIAQLHGHKWGKALDEGLKLVFPELESEETVRKKLGHDLRAAIAHMGITTNIILQRGFSDPIVWGKYRGNQTTIVINPHLMLTHIRAHFDKYIASLRDPSPENDEKRRAFLKRIRKPAS